MALQRLFLFGGLRPWSPLDWTAQDDRVRGGSSQSYLDASPFSPTAVFYGNLDTTTLGGAGFASQRTTCNCTWDLSMYDGISLDIEKTDGKKYTLTLKDQISSRSTNGSEQSTISWEYDFVTADLTKHERGEGGEIFVPWENLVPTYRGRNLTDATPLDLKNIKSFSLMMRSFFNAQSGPFSINITSISAAKRPAALRRAYRDGPSPSFMIVDEKHPSSPPRKAVSSLSTWSSWLSGGCFRY